MSNEERIYKVCGCLIDFIDALPEHYTVTVDRIRDELISIRENIDNQIGG